LGGQAYATKKAIEDRCRELLRRPTAFSEEEHSFLADLLALHHEADDKIGCGVTRFYSDGDNWGKRCFWLERVDGTKTDWSFKTCLKPPTHEKDVLAALRLLVDPQVRRFRDRELGGKQPVLCAITRQPVTRATVHVDHTPPSTFFALVGRFLSEARIDYSSIAIRPTSDGSTTTELADVDLAERWRAFHEKHADLRLTLATANLSQGAG
jgi:hypothetical protein